MKLSSVKEVLNNAEIGEKVLVGGWIRTFRASKQIMFIELSDGSCQQGLQAVVPAEHPQSKELEEKAGTGASIVLQGEIVESPAKGQRVELAVKNIEFIGEAEGFPIQKKKHSLEFLREVAHLRVRTRTLGAAFRVRSKAAWAIHKFFQERGYFWVHTPIITTIDCEGAGEAFTVTTLDFNKLPILNGKVNFKEDFFGKRAYLTVSGQLEAEALALGLTKVYTFGPTFRAENSNTARHLSEFWMIEPEVAFCDLEEDMHIAEEFVKCVIKDVLGSCEDDLHFLHTREWVKEGLKEALEDVIKKPFEVLEYSDAIKALQDSGESFEFPVTWGLDLQAEHEKYLTEKYIKGPVFVINYPKEIKAFYMRVNSDEKTVAAMDLLVPRLGEIIGGSQREEREEVLEKRVKECGLSEDDYRWYLELRRWGSVAHAGFGLGFERFLQYITGLTNIRDVIPFPRAPGQAKF